MSKRFALFLALSLFCGLAPLAAQNNAFGVWDMPNGSIYIYIDLDSNMVRGAYGYEPYLSHTSYGVIDGTAEGTVLNGQWLELGWDDSMSMGNITLTFDGDTKAFSVVVEDAEGNVTAEYDSEYLRSGDEGDVKYFANIREKVQEAIDERYN